MTSSRRTPVPTVFAVSLVIASVAVFLQAVTAGIFVNQDGRDSWVTVHGVIADLTWISALVAAVVGFARLRRTYRALWWGAAALFVLSLAQTGIGHLITDGGVDALIVVHVPLALVIFGLAGWLLLALVAARHVARREISADEPYMAEPAQPLPLANRR